MALKHTTSLVSTTPAAIVTLPMGTPVTAVQIYNGTGAAIAIGDATVGTSGATQGNAISNAASLQVWIRGGDTIYAVCASAPAGYVSVIYSA